MRKKICFNVIGVASLISASLAGGITAFIYNSHKEVKSTEAYSPSSLPTTIDLNDCTETEIRNYYSGLSSLSESERQGTNLLKNLKTILKTGQKYYSYDTDNNGRKIWQIYEIADRDWVKSPASDLSGYNSETNKITGYSYGTSRTDSGTNPYIHALYVDREVDNNVRAWAKTGTTTSSHGNNAEWCIDREHIWAKSHGFDAEGVAGARGDLMHLWPSDSDVNSSIHNNRYFGYVFETKNQGKWSYGTNNVYGSSLTRSDEIVEDEEEQANRNVFEPQDSDKGDIARALFYMVARYNYLSGSDSDGIDQNNPNLGFTQTSIKGPTKTSSTTDIGLMGVMTDLLAWHRADPVDEYEIHRNNLLYRNYTNNRNPFIDFPEWVDYIWGTATYEGRYYQSYDETPTGYADPTQDVVNGYIDHTGVEISQSEMSILTGNSMLISATSSDGSAIHWSSSDESVATVGSSISGSGTSITIEGVAPGTATITASATINDTVYEDTCLVTVSDEVVLSSIEVKTNPTKTTYKAGECFDPSGLEITRTYSDSSTDTYKYNEHPSEFSFDPSTSEQLTTSNKKVTVTYGSKTCAVDINVVLELTGITISGETKEFEQNAEFTFGGKVTANYHNGSHKDVSDKATFSGYDLSKLGNQTVTVSYTEGEITKTATYAISVVKGENPNNNKKSIPTPVIIAIGGGVAAVVIIGIFAGVLKVNKKGKIKVNKSGVKKAIKKKKK